MVLSKILKITIKKIKSNTYYNENIHHPNYQKNGNCTKKDERLFKNYYQKILNQSKI